MYTPAISNSFLSSIGSKRRRRGGKKKNKIRRLRAKLIELDPYCYYCGCFLTLDTSTLDHALPSSKGGKSDFSNAVLACYQCNQDKGDKIIVIWGR